MWYGVDNKNTRELVYASGGHPPAVLFNGTEVVLLKTPGLIVGGMPDTEFQVDKITLEKPSKLYVFSDGVYEIERADGTVYPLEDFIKTLGEPSKAGEEDLERILREARTLNGPGPFADDFSIIELEFPSERV